MIARRRRLAGSSSGKIPPASVRPLPKACQVVGMDTCEWSPPNHPHKYKVLLMMGLATKFKTAHVLLKYGAYEYMKAESAQMVVDASQWSVVPCEARQPRGSSLTKAFRSSAAKVASSWRRCVLHVFLCIELLDGCSALCLGRKVPFQGSRPFVRRPAKHLEKSGAIPT